MLLAAALLTIGAVVLTLFVRTSSLPEPELVSPARHLEERKAAIYDNLRDLEFEFRLGKLSDADYEQTKAGLQKELAQVQAEIERLSGEPPASAAPLPPKPLPGTCPHCGAKFDKPMRFCGECGKPMTGDAA